MEYFKGQELHELWGGSGHGLISNIGQKILDLAERDPQKAEKYGFHLDPAYVFYQSLILHDH
jgi:hypothetical protein